MNQFNQTERVIGNVLGARLSNLDRRFVEVNVLREDQVNPTMLLYPSMAEQDASSLLRRMQSSIGSRAALIVTSREHALVDVPAAFGPDVAILELLIPLDEFGRLRAA